MRTFERFGSFADHIVNDPRFMKYGTMLIKHGRHAPSRFSPVLIWFDAAISVIEAASAYFRYAAETEVTSQLKSHTKKLKMEIDSNLKRLRLDVELYEQESEVRMQNIARAMELQREEYKLALEKITSYLDLVKVMAAAVRECREEVGNEFKQLQELQSLMDDFVRSTLDVLLEELG